MIVSRLQQSACSSSPNGSILLKARIAEFIFITIMFICIDFWLIVYENFMRLGRLHSPTW